MSGREIIIAVLAAVLGSAATARYMRGGHSAQQHEQATPTPERTPEAKEGPWWCFPGDDCFTARYYCEAAHPVRKELCANHDRAFCEGYGADQECFVTLDICEREAARAKGYPRCVETH